MFVLNSNNLILPIIIVSWLPKKSTYFKDTGQPESEEDWQKNMCDEWHHDEIANPDPPIDRSKPVDFRRGAK